MNISSFRLKAAGTHFVLSLLVASIVAFLVFVVWFPYPYRELAGGNGLFFLIIGVDLICGPLLTLIVYAPTKRRRELIIDMGLIVFVQTVALWYGSLVMYQARPLYLVHEIDRFKVVSLVDVDFSELTSVSNALAIGMFDSPKVVSLRELNAVERKNVLLESLNGGRDYGEHPTYYLPFNAKAAYIKARKLSAFIDKNPDQRSKLDEKLNVYRRLKNLERNKNKATSPEDHGDDELRYLPLLSRQDWIVLLSSDGKFFDYLKGDGF
jgi:hypothetical protein